MAMICQGVAVIKIIIIYSYFTLEKSKSRRYSARTITDTDYAGNIALRANTPTQAESLLHCMERAAGDVDFSMNADKTEYMCFNQSGDISTINGGSLKLVDKFNNLGSSVSSTENDIDTEPSRCPWCDGYCLWKWIRRHEFKSWTRLIAFHIALIPLGKVSIQLFSLQLWVNSREDWVLWPWWGN